MCCAIFAVYQQCRVRYVTYFPLITLATYANCCCCCYWYGASIVWVRCCWLELTIQRIVVVVWVLVRTILPLCTTLSYFVSKCTMNLLLHMVPTDIIETPAHSGKTCTSLTLVWEATGRWRLYVWVELIMRLSGFFDRYGVTGNSSVCVSGVKGSIVSGGT